MVAELMEAEVAVHVGAELGERLGIAGMRKAQVSRLCRGLEEQCGCSGSGRWRAAIRICG
jgi:hypothetical protein